MLTRVHKVKHLVVSTFEKGLKRWRGVGSLSPSRRACETEFSAFEKIKCIFSIIPVKSLEMSHQMLATKASDVGAASGVLWLSVTLLSEASEHPTGSRRTPARHCFSIWCFVTSAGLRVRFQTVCIGCWGASDVAPSDASSSFWTLWVASGVRVVCPVRSIWRVRHSLIVNFNV
jgi:hypothetical protein